MGHEVSGSEIDEYNISRVIFNAARSAKNLAGIVVNGKAWGSLKKHLGGSYETARAATQEDEVLKKLREDNIDVDATIDALYKSKSMKPPDKVKEAATYVAPLVDEFLQSTKPWAQVKNYAIKNYEHDNQATRRMQELEEEAAKYKQRLRSAGLQVTPKKKELPIQDGSPVAAPSSSNQGPQGGVPIPQPLQPGQDRRQKRRRLQRGAKKSYQQMLEEPFNVIKWSRSTNQHDLPQDMDWLLQFCSTFSHLLSLAVTYRLQEHFGQPIEDLTFQVDHKTGTRGLRIFKGQRRFRGSNTKVLRIQHVMELTEFLLQPAYFKVGLDTYCQIQGACMGSPLAPVLCALVAAEQEFLMIRSLRTHLADAGLLRSVRYADNRCFFLRRAELQTEWTNLLFRLDFYGLPIELEQVPGEELVGSITSTQQGTITMQQPANETTLRSLRSAGSKSAALSGFSARAFSIKKDTPDQFAWFDIRWRT